jgi:hypothetical protein
MLLQFLKDLVKLVVHIFNNHQLDITYKVLKDTTRDLAKFHLLNNLNALLGAQECHIKAQLALAPVITEMLVHHQLQTHPVHSTTDGALMDNQLGAMLLKDTNKILSTNNIQALTNNPTDSTEAAVPVVLPTWSLLLVAAQVMHIHTTRGPLKCVSTREMIGKYSRLLISFNLGVYNGGGVNK